MKEFTVEHVELVYRMCGANPINAEFSTDIINLLISKRGNPNLYDACKVKAKWNGRLNKFKPNSNKFRVYYRNRRHK